MSYFFTGITANTLTLFKNKPEWVEIIELDENEFFIGLRLGKREPGVSGGAQLRDYSRDKEIMKKERQLEQYLQSVLGENIMMELATLDVR